VVERCRELKSHGYAIALDNFTDVKDEQAALLEIADIVKIDLHQVPKSSLAGLVTQLKAGRSSCWPKKWKPKKTQFSVTNWDSTCFRVTTLPVRRLFAEYGRTLQSSPYSSC